MLAKEATNVYYRTIEICLSDVLGNPVPNNEENAKLCLCPTCPTYKKSNFSGNVFCASGKAAQPAKAAGCICPNCSVYKKYTLDQMYYCQQGKSSEIKR